MSTRSRALSLEPLVAIFLLIRLSFGGRLCYLAVLLALGIFATRLADAWGILRAYALKINTSSLPHACMRVTYSLTHVHAVAHQKTNMHTLIAKVEESLQDACGLGQQQGQLLAKARTATETRHSHELWQDLRKAHASSQD